MTDAMVTMWLKDGSVCRIKPEFAPLIEAALERLVGEDGAFRDDANRDSVLRLVTIADERVIVLASHVVGFNESTAESRKRCAAVSEQIENECKPLDASQRQPITQE